MIPDRVVELLHGPAFMQIATRSNELRPAHAWVVGAAVHDDRETVTVFVSAAGADRSLGNLQANGRIAFGVALATHEAYQIKGSYVSTRAADATDLARQERYRSALHAAALAAGYPEELARPFTLGFAYTPGVAITLRAEEIFVQTPGPDAGNAMV